MTTTFMRDLSIERAGLFPTAGQGVQKSASTGFAAALQAERTTAAPTKQELLEALSERSKEVLALLKSGGQVEKEDWTALMQELRDTGAITQEEYDWTNFELILSPIPTGKDGKPVSGLIHRGDREAEYWETLRQFEQWPGNPLDYLDMWLLSLKKERGLLDLEYRNQLGHDMSAFSGFDKQANACNKVTGLIRDLLA